MQNWKITKKCVFRYGKVLLKYDLYSILNFELLLQLMMICSHAYYVDLLQWVSTKNFYLKKICNRFASKFLQGYNSYVYKNKIVTYEHTFNLTKSLTTWVCLLIWARFHTPVANISHAVLSFCHLLFINKSFQKYALNVYCVLWQESIGICYFLS